MKLNFWQILGIALLVIGAIFVIRKQMGSSSTTSVVSPASRSVAP